MQIDPTAISTGIFLSQPRMDTASGAHAADRQSRTNELAKTWRDKQELEVAGTRALQPDDGVPDRESSEASDQLTRRHAKGPNEGSVTVAPQSRFVGDIEVGLDGPGRQLDLSF